MKHGSFGEVGALKAGVRSTIIATTILMMATTTTIDLCIFAYKKFFKDLRSSFALSLSRIIIAGTMRKNNTMNILAMTNSSVLSVVFFHCFDLMITRGVL